LKEIANIGHLSMVVTLRGTMRPLGVNWNQLVTAPLESLSLEAARQIFSVVSHNSEQSSELDALLNLMDGLPLAITLMANQGQILSIEQLTKAYEKERTRLLVRSRERRLTSLDVSIQVSLNSLTMQENPEAVTVSSILCLLPDGIDIKTLKSAIPSLKSPHEAVQAVLQVALSTYLGSRIKMLAPIREFLLAHHPPAGTTLEELRLHFMNLTEEVDKIGEEKSKEAINRLSAEFGNINSVLLHAWHGPLDDPQRKEILSATINVSKFSELASFGDCMRVLTTGTNNCHGAGDLLGFAQCSAGIGRTLRMRDRYGESIGKLEEAKVVFEGIGNRLGTAQCMQGIGDALQMRDRHEESIGKLEEAKVAFEGIGNRLGTAQCLQGIGDALRMLDRYEESIGKLEEAKIVFEGIGDRLGMAQCMRGIGDALRMLDRYEESIGKLEEAKLVFEGIGNRLGMAQCMRGNGDALHLLDRHQESIAKLQEAKVAFEDIGNRLGTVQCMRGIGDALHLLDRHEESIVKLEEAKVVFEGIGDRLGMAQCMRDLGETLRMLDRHDEALVKLEAAKAQFDAMGRRRETDHCAQIIHALRRAMGQ